MKRILLLDTNLSSLPIYEYLVKSNYEVYVIGSNPNDFLAKYAKNYIKHDYRLIKDVRRLISKYKIDFIIPGCNDVSYKCCVILNSKKNFFGIDSKLNNEIINNKQKFRKFATQNLLSIPKVLTNPSISKKHPIIVKPVDAYSGRGITIVRDKSKLDNAINFAIEFSDSKSYIIEEFVEGNLYSHSAFISNSNIFIDFIVEEYSTSNQFAVDTSRVDFGFPKVLLKRIRNEILIIVKKLNIKEGLIHTQFIRQNSKFWIIEVTRRCPGDLYSRLVESSTGFEYVSNYVDPFLGKKLKRKATKLTKKYIVRHTISSSKDISLSYIKLNYPVLIESYFPLSKSGDMVKKSPFGRLGLLFLETKNMNESNFVINKSKTKKLYKLL